MAQQPYYSSYPFQKSIQPRSIRLPTDTDDFVLNDDAILTDPYLEGWYFLFTGCPSNTTIGQIVVTFTYEFVPQQAYSVICAQSLPSPGVATQAAIANLITQFPGVWHLPQQKATELAQLIMTENPSCHDSLLSLLRDKLGVTTHTVKRHVHCQEVDDAELIGVSANSSYIDS